MIPNLDNRSNRKHEIEIFPEETQLVLSHESGGQVRGQRRKMLEEKK